MTRHESFPGALAVGTEPHSAGETTRVPSEPHGHDLSARSAAVAAGLRFQHTLLWSRSHGFPVIASGVLRAGLPLPKTGDDREGEDMKPRPMSASAT